MKHWMKHWMLGMALTASLALVGCGGGNEENAGAHYVGSLAIPGFTGPGNTASFDLGTVTNTSPGHYYFTDRNNAAVDVIDTATNRLIAQIQGTGANAFSGCRNAAGAPSDCASPPQSSRRSGPNGIDPITATKIYAPDVDSVKVIDTTTNTVTKSIKLGTLTGFPDTTNARADEGCFDKDHNIYMISTNQPVPPFVSFIDTTTDTLIASVRWSGGPFDGPPAAAGNEACVYDSRTQSFLVNNVSTAANPRGEVEVIPASLITPFKAAPMAAGASITINSFGAAVKRFPLPACDPTGLALGPGNDIAVGCRPGVVGDLLTVLILDRTNGTILATLNAGGGDQIWYDPTSNRYANSASRWNSSGKSTGACSATNPCSPNLIIIDAATRTVIAMLPTGNNAHSVAVDPVTGSVYMPYSSDTAPAGFQRDARFLGTADGGVSIYTIK